MNRTIPISIVFILYAISSSFAQENIYSFRAEPLDSISPEEVKKMLSARGFFDTYLNKKGRGFPNNFRYGENGRVVIDDNNNLIWQQSGSVTRVTLQEAETFIDSLNQHNFAGRHNWRLPTLEETLSLTEREQLNGELFIDPIFDPRQQWIWTSDKVDDTQGWAVYFLIGYCNPIRKDYYAYIRAVSSLQPQSIEEKEHVSEFVFPNVPRSNFTEVDAKNMLEAYTFYCTPNNTMGELYNLNGKGFANNFEVQKNGFVVLDHAAGLMWQQEGSFDYKDQYGAYVYIDSLNHKNFAGFNDWRLPTLAEAMSLLENEVNNGTLHIDPVFSDNQLRIWTADQKDNNIVWIVDFYYATFRHYDKHYTHFVRAVRSNIRPR